MTNLLNHLNFAQLLMAYFFRQKLNIADLTVLTAQPKKILIYEPEEYVFALYRYYLTAHSFDVYNCPKLSEARDKVSSWKPHVIIFNADCLSPSTMVQLGRLFSDLSFDFPGLRLISTGLSGEQQVKELMAMGVSSHINTRFSRPHDLVHIVRSIL